MLEDRVYQVLWAVVDSYITNPDPVGSRFVTKKYDFNLSSATIRNIMADLEDMGFLHQPHTSSGRVPTDKGYRFYVDSISRKEGIEDPLLAEELTIGLENIRNDMDFLLGETTHMLSSLSRYIGVALSPKPEKSIFKRINMFRHKGNTVAITLLTDEGTIQNKFIRLDPELMDLSTNDFNRISEYLNSEFSGFTLDEIKTLMLNEMCREKALCDTLLSRSIKICEEALYFGNGNIFISGFSEALGLPDFSDLERIKEFSRAIEDKHMIIKLLDMLSESDGVMVLIGSESPSREMKKLSMVVSNYKEGNRAIGTVGIIGPTRMDYQKAIRIVDTTARFITRVMNDK